MKTIRCYRYCQKGIGYIGVVPYMYICIIIPVVCVMTYRHQNNMQEVYECFIRLTHYFVPGMSVWNSVFLLNHLIEAPMHEILYLRKRIHFIEVAIPSICFHFALLLLFFVFHYYFTDIIWLYCKLFVIDFMLLSITYAASYAFGKVLVAIFLNMMWTIRIIVENVTGRADIRLMTLDVFAGEVFFRNVIPYVVVLAVGTIMGMFFNYYYIERFPS